MRHVLFAAVACIGCGKELNSKFCAAHPDDERCGSAASVDAVFDSHVSTMPVSHLGYETELLLTSDVNVTITTAGLVIDTTAGTVPNEFDGAVVLPDVPQDDGPNVMVIHVGSLTIDLAADASINVDGDRPLVIVATRTIHLMSGRLNASADVEEPGPGGFASALGPGAGAPGLPSGVAYDGGGGGASYGTSGGRGGNPMGGAAGALYGAPTSLQGGSGGGVPSLPGACTVLGGAGGGAVQLTALESITIAGLIHVGGGGGDGGETCGDGAGGGGGGSGGMIFLEAPMLLGSGVLGSLGGGGGEAGSTQGVYAGVAGEDAEPETAGAGGTSGNSGGNGGLGATETAPGAPGMDGPTEGNGGGGGGGAGRIYYRTSGAAPTYIARPPATNA